LSYWLAFGAIPDELFVCHRCDVKHCVNPHHLFLGTCKDNMIDAKNKNRMASGEKNGAYLHPERLARGARHGRFTKPERTARGVRSGQHTKPHLCAKGDRVNTAKLTWPQVDDMRRLAREGFTASELSSQFHIGYSTARRILLGQYWKEEYRLCPKS
jgi:hypothetical protein